MSIFSNAKSRALRKWREDIAAAAAAEAVVAERVKRLRASGYDPAVVEAGHRTGCPHTPATAPQFGRSGGGDGGGGCGCGCGGGGGGCCGGGGSSGAMAQFFPQLPQFFLAEYEVRTTATPKALQRLIQMVDFGWMRPLRCAEGCK
jgi:hypothetical protein